METIAWELSVLSRAVAFQNLSGASQHVGISQPQLSRIIKKLENELGAPLLDRSIKRKSFWLPIARQIAQAYVKSSHNLSSHIQSIVGNTQPQHIKIGSLEGLILLAMSFGHRIAENSKIKSMELNVYDLDQLEERFFKGEIDLLISSREPGRKKFTNSRILGYQYLAYLDKTEKWHVMSSFEFGQFITHQHRAKKPTDTVAIVSNSLAARRAWFENYGGMGRLPSAIQKTPIQGKDNLTVYLIASDTLPITIWQDLSKFNPKLY